MTVKLYVDKIILDQVAKAGTKLRVEYNCKSIGTALMDSIMAELLTRGNISHFFAAGRYFGYVSIHLEKNKYQMILVDLKNNEDIFYNFLQGGFSKSDIEQREAAIRVFNVLKQQYSKNYNDVELIEGDPPIID